MSVAGVAFWVGILCLVGVAASASLPFPFTLAFLLVVPGVVGLLYLTRRP